MENPSDGPTRKKLEKHSLLIFTDKIQIIMEKKYKKLKCRKI